MSRPPDARPGRPPRRPESPDSPDVAAGPVPPYRRPGVVLAAVVLALLALEALLLRGLLHPAPHTGGDNAAYVALAWSLVTGQGYTELWDPAAVPHTRYPPVFPLMLAARIATGGLTWAALKVVTALAALVAVAATFLWARGRAGLAVGAGVALLTAMSPAVLDYGRWILSDVPFLAFTLLALWAAERGDPAGDGGDARGRTRTRTRPDPIRDPDGGPDPDAAGPARARDLDPDASGPTPAGGWEADRARSPALWWSAAILCTGLAYFTRSAGLPLVLAVLGVLALRRQWRVLAFGGGALAAAAGAWVLRGRAVQGDVTDYASAFWLLDPYDPAQGLAGPVDLLGRVAGNIGGYLTLHMPLGLTGRAQGIGLAVGVGVTLLGLAGWALRVRRRRIGAAELFLPLYAGLILLWPEVWSGDRFALPLIPLLLLWAAGALRAGCERIGLAGAATGAVAAAGGLTLLAQVPAYQAMAREAAGCRGAVDVMGPYVCAGPVFLEFADAARWSGANLPPDAVVLTRKPRIWYALSGRPSRTYPFDTDPEALLAFAQDAGADWVLLDFIGDQGIEFLAAALTAQPGAFCAVAGFGGDEGRPGTQLFGILPPEQRTEGAGADEDGRVTIVECPPALAGGSGEAEPYSASSPIPILAGPPPP